MKRCLAVAIVLTAICTITGCNSPEDSAAVEFRVLRPSRQTLIPGGYGRVFPSLIDRDGSVVWWGTTDSGDLNEKTTLESVSGDTRPINLPAEVGSSRRVMDGKHDPKTGNYVMLYDHSGTDRTYDVGTTAWSLASWNPQSNRVVVLDRQDLGIEPWIAVDNGYVYFTKAVDVGGVLVANAYRIYEEGGREPELFEADTGHVEVSWPYAFVVKRHSATPADGVGEGSLSAERSKEASYFVERIDVRTRERKTIPGEVRSTAAMKVGDSMIAIGRDNGSLDIFSLELDLLLHLETPQVSRIRSIFPIDDGFIFQADTSANSTDYFSAMLVRSAKKWTLVRFARHTSSSSNYVAHKGFGQWIYWSDPEFIEQKPSLKYPVWRNFWHRARIREIVGSSTRLASGGQALFSES